MAATTHRTLGAPGDSPYAFARVTDEGQSNMPIKIGINGCVMRPDAPMRTQRGVLLRFCKQGAS